MCGQHLSQPTEPRIQIESAIRHAVRILAADSSVLDPEFACMLPPNFGLGTPGNRPKSRAHGYLRARRAAAQIPPQERNA